MDKDTFGQEATNFSCDAVTNIILPEVYNLSKPKYLTCKKVAAGKRISVHFDHGTLEFVGLTDEFIRKLKFTFPGIDVDSELNKMTLWLSEKGKTRKGHIGFIMAWLSRASPSRIAPDNSEHIELLEPHNPLRELLLDYLKGLWQGREHILEFNKIKRPS